MHKREHDLYLYINNNSCECEYFVYFAFKVLADDFVHLHFHADNTEYIHVIVAVIVNGKTQTAASAVRHRCFPIHPGRRFIFWIIGFSSIIRIHSIKTHKTLLNVDFIFIYLFDKREVSALTWCCQMPLFMYVYTYIDNRYMDCLDLIFLSAQHNHSQFQPENTIYNHFQCKSNVFVDIFNNTNLFKKEKLM